MAYVLVPRIRFEKVVRAERERIFDILTDYAGYESRLPRFFTSVRIRSCRGDVSVVEEHMRIAGRELVMMTRHVVRRPELHEISVLGGDAKGSHIIERYSTAPGGTRIAVDAEIRLRGTMMITGLFAGKKIRNDLCEIMDGFARIAGG